MTASSAGIPAVTSVNMIKGDRANVSQTFDNKNVGTGKRLTPNGFVNSGNSRANYSVTFVNGSLAR